jgi:hypothetical protein
MSVGAKRSNSVINALSSMGINHAPPPSYAEGPFDRAGVHSAPEAFDFGSWRDLLSTSPFWTTGNFSTSDSQGGRTNAPTVPPDTLSASAWMDRFLQDLRADRWTHHGLHMISLFSTSNYNDPYVAATPDQRHRMLCHYASSPTHPIPPDLLPDSAWKEEPDLALFHDLLHHDWNEDLQEFHNSNGCPE